MIQIEDVLLSKELFKEHFVCDLSYCKGACCVEGDAGAPIELAEIEKVESNLDGILPFLTEEGKTSIQRQGVFTIDTDGEYVTPLNEGKECSFTIFDQNGTAKCGIEAAFRAGKSDFKKPQSCQLYPIRVSRLKHYEALNYHRWSICAPACECGSRLKVKVFQFLKEPLTDKYGEEWYRQLVEVDKLLAKEDTN